MGLFRATSIKLAVFIGNYEFSNIFSTEKYIGEFLLFQVINLNSNTTLVLPYYFLYSHFFLQHGFLLRSRLSLKINSHT